MTKIYNLGLILIFSLSFVFFYNSNAQETAMLSKRISNPDSSNSGINSEISINKVIPAKFQAPVLAALSHYPELKGIKIKFIERKINACMEARPRLITTFRRPSKRQYIILINNNPDHPSIDYEKLTYKSQVGVFGHELAHIQMYTQTRFWEMLACGVRYSNLKFKEKFEKDTDIRTIEHGLGWEMLEFENQVQADTTIPQWYKEYKGKTYLTAAEILERLNTVKKPSSIF